MKRLLCLFLCLLALPCQGARWRVWSNASVAFTPNSLGSLVAWWKQPVAGGVNSSALTTWPNSCTATSGSYNMTTAGNKPTYFTGIQNGLPAILFDDATARFYDATGPSASTYPYTLFAVISPTDALNAYTIFGGSGGTGGLQLRVDGSRTLTLNSGSVAGIGTSTGTLTAGVFNYIVVTVTSTTYAFYINGASAGSGSHSTVLTASRTIEIGSQVSNSETMRGYIAECGICNVAESAPNIALLNAYLASTWGL